MSYQSPSANLESTWGKFTIQSAAKTTQTKLIEAGIDPSQISLEKENFATPIRLEDTESIANLKTGAIAGAVLGGLVGLSFSLIQTSFFNLGWSALNNFQTIHYLIPLLGAVVGGLGISLISGLSGASIPKSQTAFDRHDRDNSPRYLVVVKGTNREVSLAREIIDSRGGVIEADRQRSLDN